MAHSQQPSIDIIEQIMLEPIHELEKHILSNVLNRINALPQGKTLKLKSQERIRKEAIEECVKVLEERKEETNLFSTPFTLEEALTRIKSII